MKIALIAPTYLPARRANTIQVMKMAQALTTLGHELRVYVPLWDHNNHKPTWNHISHHYGLQERFEIEWLETDPRLRSYDYGLISVRRAQQWSAELVYSRLPQAAAIASFKGIPTIYEIHDFPQGKLGPWLMVRFCKGSGARALVVITAALRDSLTEKFGNYVVNQTGTSIPIIIVPDGVDLARYQKIPSPQQTRLTLPLPLKSESLMAGYTGNLYSGRGIRLLLDVAEQLPDKLFLLVGGENKDEVRIRQLIQSRELENVILTGFVPNSELPRYQAACDILLMPYQHNVAASSGGNIGKYLSPMKLFEYMACGRAIVSSDLPVLREILNNENAVLVPPDDLNGWVYAIRNLFANSEKRAQLAAQAQKDVQQYSWNNRAQKILASIET